MNTVFMNSKNSKTSDSHRLLLNLTDKTDLRRKNKYIALSNLSNYYTWKNIKKSYKNNKCKSIGKNTSKSFTVNIVKNFWIMLNNLQQMRLKLAQCAKRVVQKTEEVTGDLIGNKIADKIKRCSKA